MTHDPLCEWSAPCVHGENQQHSRDTENLAVLDATYCWMCGADCHCDLIAKVRKDERHKAEMHDYHQPAWMAGHTAALNPDTNARMHAMTREDAIRECIAAVEATWHAVCDRKEYPQCDYCYIVIDVLETLRDLREKPTPPPLPPSVGVPEKRWFR